MPGLRSLTAFLGLFLGRTPWATRPAGVLEEEVSRDVLRQRRRGAREVLRLPGQAEEREQQAPEAPAIQGLAGREGLRVRLRRHIRRRTAHEEVVTSEPGRD